MPRPIPLSRTPRLLLAAAAWTLLLVGLFVMHGAGSHGTTTHASAPVAGTLGLAGVESGHTGHDGAAHGGDRPQGSEDDEPPGHSGAELCLAILCALLSALAAFAAATRPRRPQFEVRRAGRALTPPWLRPPDSPCLIRLSILRC